MNALENLYAVQQIDSAIDLLRHRRVHLPELLRRRELDLLLADLARRRALIDTQLGELASAGNNREHELNAIAKRRKELDRRLASSSVPREVLGFTDELATLVERQRGIEDVELEAMEQIETLESERAALDDRFASAQAERDQVVAVLSEEEAVIGHELDELVARRPDTIDGIDPGLLARYDKMRERFGGVAVARLDKNRCDGCHLEMSATELEHIRREPADALIECEHCGRLLLR